jgi:uncharacterized membrane protein YheB (UPF0754 family)
MNEGLSIGLYIATSVLFGAVIGGVTNHLAIKMLFHPRTEWRLWGMRVPFTPGLIPKRRDEIGGALGRVVSDYLVTTRGLSDMLEKPELRDKLENTLTRFIDDWTSKEDTIGQWWSRYASPEQMEATQAKLLAGARDIAVQGAEYLWAKHNLGERPLQAIVPGWSLERKEKLIAWAVDALTLELRREILSPNGDRLLRQMTSQLMEQAGGFLGAMASIFMDEGKVMQKVKHALMSQLESPAFRMAVATLIERKIGELEQLTAGEVVSRLTERDGKEWLLEKVGTAIPWEEWADRLQSMPIRQLIGPFREQLLAAVPSMAGWILKALQSNIERIVQVIQLPKLVEEQVEKFPIERLEEIILSVSGKEFRAITWLGALLGGLIGLLQPLMNMWLR